MQLPSGKESRNPHSGTTTMQIIGCKLSKSSALTGWQQYNNNATNFAIGC
jgi:hypothetical protein